MIAKRGIFICAAFIFAPITAAAEEPQSPDAFLQSVYAHYAPEQKPLAVVGDDSTWLFEDSLLALIRQDQETAAARGEVGLLDGDPICDCQEYEKLDDLKIAASPETDGKSSADVSFVNNGEPVKLRIDLVRAGQSWKIYDISDSGVGTLRNFLQKGLAEEQKP